MGYYTTFALGVLVEGMEGPQPSMLHAQRLSEIADYLPETLLGRQPVKWYSEERNQHMTALSREFPREVFVLTGQGEDPFDRWEETWVDGGCIHRRLDPEQGVLLHEVDGWVQAWSKGEQP